MKAKLLGSDDELVAIAVRLLWDLDTFLADAAADRVGHLKPCDRDALLQAICAMRRVLATARAEPRIAPARLSALTPLA